MLRHTIVAHGNVLPIHASPFIVDTRLNPFMRSVKAQTDNKRSDLCQITRPSLQKRTKCSSKTYQMQTTSFLSPLYISSVFGCSSQRGAFGSASHAITRACCHLALGVHIQAERVMQPAGTQGDTRSAIRSSKMYDIPFGTVKL